MPAGRISVAFGAGAGVVADESAEVALTVRSNQPVERSLEGAHLVGVRRDWRHIDDWPRARADQRRGDGAHGAGEPRVVLERIESRFRKALSPQLYRGRCRCRGD